MITCFRWLTVLLVVTASLWSAPATAVVVGQTDTFEDATTQGWVNNVLGLGVGATPPTNLTGGPAGPDDNFLLVTADGIGAGRRLSVINLSQWAGDYLAAGISAIRMDVNNLGSTDLSLRLLFFDQPSEIFAVSTVPVIVPAGSGWTEAFFPIEPADLTVTGGSANEALSNATGLRIFHNSVASFPGPPIIALLGVDNITALPEPGTAVMLALGGGALIAWRRRPLRERRRQTTRIRTPCSR